MRGFTLVETLISLTIMSLIVAGIYAIVNVADVSWNAETALLDIQQQVRLAMDGMTREIRQAKPADVTVSSTGDRVEFFVPGVTDSVGYYLQVGSIVRKHPAGTGTVKILANDISSLNFCCIGGAGCSDCASASSIQIQIQAAKTMKGRTATFPLTGKIMLRNE